MKKTLYLIVAVLTALMLISSVSAVPNVKVDENEELMEKILDNFNSNSRLYDSLLDRLISELGQEVYDKVYIDTKILFYDASNIEYYTTGTDLIPNDDTPYVQFINGMVDIAVLIILFMIVLLGYDGILGLKMGPILGALGAAIVLFIPCLIVGMVGGIVSTVDIVTCLVFNGNSNGIGDLLRDYGVIGVLLVVCLYLPLIALISIFVYPIYATLLTIDTLFCLIMEAFEIANDIYS